MKRLTILIIAMTLALTSCYSPVSRRIQGWFNRQESQDARPEFNIWITNQTDEAIHRVNFIYYLDDQALGGGVIGPFFWKNLRNGEEVSMYFHPEDFPDEADLSQFSIEYTFENADDETFVVNDLFELDAQYGKDYRVSLTGNRLDGFDLSLMN